MKPKDPGNIQMLSEGHEPAWVLTDATTFANGEVTIVGEESEITLPYAQTALGTSVEMHDLRVIAAYTTDNEESDNHGAITLICENNGNRVSVRTVPLYKADGTLAVERDFLYKTIDVRGIVDYYDGKYQIKVFTLDAITINK